MALSPEAQVDRCLPTAPPKATDRRSFTAAGTTQAEALLPDILTQLVLAAVEDSVLAQAELAHQGLGDPQICRVGDDTGQVGEGDTVWPSRAKCGCHTCTPCCCSWASILPAVG